jgi:hypothetical protein
MRLWSRRGIGRTHGPEVAGGLRHAIPPTAVSLSNSFVVEQPRDWGTADRYLSRGRITPVGELAHQRLPTLVRPRYVPRLSPPRISGQYPAACGGDIRCTTSRAHRAKRGSARPSSPTGVNRPLDKYRFAVPRSRGCSTTTGVGEQDGGRWYGVSEAGRELF